MKRRMKNVLTMLLAMFLITGLMLAESSTIHAETAETSESETTFREGLLRGEVIEIPYVDAEETYDVQESGISLTSEMYEAQVYNHEWDKYKNYYIYNQLTDDEREFWNALDEVCLCYLTTTNDAECYVYGGTDYYYTTPVGSSALTAEEEEELVWMFKYQNPQYYFLSYAVVSTAQNGTIYYGIVMYSEFADGAARSTATAAVEAQADEWEEEIEAAGGTDEEKLLLIHDLIVNKVDYNDTVYSVSFDEDTQYSQSAYSVFCTDYTVCAGYSLALEMMCNAVGIDAIAVTSESHAWNKVRLNDSWYNVDATWADQEPIYYEYYERSDDYYDTVNSESASSHAEEDMWEGYLPLCTLDADVSGDYSTPGTLPEITQTTAAPQITVSASGDSYAVEITCGTAGAQIYYTLDGTTPSPSATKSYLYQEAFQTDSSQIQAVAVCDTYLDSGVQTGVVDTDTDADTDDEDTDTDTDDTGTGDTDTDADTGDTDADTDTDTDTDGSETVTNGLVERDGKYYFYEDGVMAVSKEAYVNGAWRWFDADGSMAVSKDVYLTSSGGKWVRYNEYGEMVKGEDYRYGGWYYFEPVTGTMMKGPVVLEDGRKVFYDEITGQMVKGSYSINGETYVFDETDGHLLSGTDDLIWVTIDGKQYWYEDWQRQGWAPADEAYRGKEIYDPASDAWYWLDNVQQGAMAAGKDVYQESYASDTGDYGEYLGDDGLWYGKWVRYDSDGVMVKGWDSTDAGIYYFDLVTGAMAKGWVTIDGVSYYFDETTGVRR